MSSGSAHGGRAGGFARAGPGSSKGSVCAFALIPVSPMGVPPARAPADGRSPRPSSSFQTGEEARAPRASGAGAGRGAPGPRRGGWWRGRHTGKAEAETPRAVWPPSEKCGRRRGQTQGRPHCPLGVPPGVHRRPCWVSGAGDWWGGGGSSRLGTAAWRPLIDGHQLQGARSSPRFCGDYVSKHVKKTLITGRTHVENSPQLQPRVETRPLARPEAV